MKTTAIILGASGHVGQNLTHYLEGNVDEVLPYSRSGYAHIPISLFAPNSPDASMLINCIGVGTPKKEAELGAGILDLEHEWDDKCLDYLDSHPNTTYFHFSSGVADERFNYDDAYLEAKRDIEAKHKKYPYRIFDIRLFSFFTRFIDLDNAQFMPTIIRAILKNETAEITSVETTRDYIHPCDLTSSILMMYNSDSSGGAYEVGSSKPVTKSEILEWFVKNYGLLYKKMDCGVGKKDNYAPLYPSTGFVSSMDTIIHEAKYILGER